MTINLRYEIILLLIHLLEKTSISPITCESSERNRYDIELEL